MQKKTVMAFWTTKNKIVVATVVFSMFIVVMISAGCGVGSDAPTTVKAYFPVPVATAASEHALGLADPLQNYLFDPSLSHQMLAKLMPSPYLPVEQDLLITQQTSDQLKSFYNKQMLDKGFASEVAWADVSKDTLGASWSKQNLQARVIINLHLNADTVKTYNTTFNLNNALKEGDTMIYLIGIDRSKAL